MNFLCFDTEDNSKELLACGLSGFDKAVTQIAAMTAEGKKFYAGCPVDCPAIVASCYARINEDDFKPSKQELTAIKVFTVLQRAHQPKLIKEFIRWLQQQPEKYVYALNIQYDLGNLFSSKLDDLDVTMVGGRVIKAAWDKKLFVDVFNIWPMSVKKLGEAFELEKLDTNDMATDRAYVFRDVEIIRKAMLFAWEFCQPLGIEHLPPTLGGLCVKVWKCFGGENCHDSTLLSREAYFGGRVELFKKINDSDKVAWTDINSLYPSVMLKEFPGMLGDCGTKLAKFGVAKVRIKIPKLDFSPLPWRNEDGRIFYPWGTIEGTWTIFELREAEKRGAVIEKVFSCFGTDEALTPYAGFVNKLYEARLRAMSEAEKLFFKLLMNNLYGRLGSGGKIGRTVWQTEKNSTDGVPFGEKVFVEYQMPLSDETNWVHAAYVTAYGRIALLEFMETVGADRMIYCDTDSCIFDCPDGKIPFQTGSKLGQMKLEQCCASCQNKFSNGKKPCCKNPVASDFWPGCETYAPKMYRAGASYKAKGVPQRLAKQYIQTGHAEFDLPFKMREAIRFFDRDNARRLSVWRGVAKVNRQTYDRKNFKNNRFTPCKKTLAV